MAVLVEFSVNREKEPVVEARIFKKDYSEDDIEVKYARLAMRYLGQINEEGMAFEDNPHIPEVKACIAFSRSEEEIDLLTKEDAFQMELDDLDPDFDWQALTEPDSDDNEMSIGFKLFVEDIDVIGGLATPPVVAATKIHELILEARNNVKA